MNRTPRARRTQIINCLGQRFLKFEQPLAGCPANLRIGYHRPAREPLLRNRHPRLHPGARQGEPDDAFLRCLMWPTTASCVAVTVVALKVETFGQVQYWLVLPSTKISHAAGLPCGFADQPHPGAKIIGILKERVIKDSTCDGDVAAVGHARPSKSSAALLAALKKIWRGPVGPLGAVFPTR
jgi:hypothetical protein